MKDRNVLQAKINRCDDNPLVWEIILGYLDAEYNQMTMYHQLTDHYEGDQKSSDTIAWEISDWENG